MDIRKLARTMRGESPEDKDDDELMMNQPQAPPLLEEEDGMEGIDVSQSMFNNQQTEAGNNQNDNSQPDDDENMYDQEAYDDLEDDSNTPSIYAPPSATINHYQTIDSAQQGFDIIAGINDVPSKYRDENLIPELVAPSIQYNRFKGYVAQAEWQIKGRSLIRKHQMYRLDYPLDDRDVAGYTYLNDLLLNRADDGFERKMSNSSLSGVYQENATESAPASPRRKSSFFGSMFGGGGD